MSFDTNFDTDIGTTLGSGSRFLKEMEKALRGEPSCVKLAPMPEAERLTEQKLHDAGYAFAFGRGWPSRAAFVEWLIENHPTADYRSGSSDGEHIEKQQKEISDNMNTE